MSQSLTSPKFRCDSQNCGQIFDNKQEFNEHKEIHENLKMTEVYRNLLKRKLNYDKNECINSYETNDMNSNITNNNENVEQLKTNLNPPVIWMNAMNTLDLKNVCDFPNCGEIFNNDISLNSHQIIHKNMNANNFCYVFKTRKVGNSLLYLCVWPQCQFETNVQCLMSEHMGQHFGKKPFKCHFINCFEKFKFRSHFQSHEFSHYYKTIRELNFNFHFNCDWNQCLYKTNNIDLIEKHIENHLSVKSFRCDQENCDKVYSCNSMLNLHELSSHQSKSLIDLSYYFDKQIEENSEVYICEWPHCLFNTPFDSNTMFKHIKEHHTNQ